MIEYQHSDDETTLPFKVAKARLRREACNRAESSPIGVLSEEPVSSHRPQRWQWLQDWRVCRLRWQYRQEQMPWQQRLGYASVGLLVVFSLLTLGALLFPASRPRHQLFTSTWYVSAANKANEQTSSEITNRAALAAIKPDRSLDFAQTSEQAPVSEPANLTLSTIAEPAISVSAEYMIVDVPAGKQERNLNCEFQSAADLARFYGQPISWEDVFLSVGHDPNGDPNVGFVGSSFEDSPGSLYPDGYGVYAEPLAEGLRKLGLNARAFSHRDLEWLMIEISSGRPVIVWATYEMAPREVEGWHTRDGHTWVKAVRNEHTYTVVGYDSCGVYVNDPFDGQQYHYPWDAFLNSWGYLDQMAVSVQPPFLL